MFTLSRSSQEASSLIDSTPTNHLNFQWTPAHPVLHQACTRYQDAVTTSTICKGHFSPHTFAALYRGQVYQCPNLRKKGKVLLLLTDFYRDSDSQSINAKTKIDHFQIHLFKEVYMINPRKLIFDSDYSETECLYSLRGVRVLRGGMLKQSNMLLSG